MVTAALKLDNEERPLAYDRKIFGHFIEHFHRQVYGGIYDPGNPLSDDQGFRKDVVDALRELKVPVVRWPGGCFVSAYHWRNGVGKARTPAWDKAWHVEDPNTFGTDEFIAWCGKIGAEPYICTNAGTGTQEEMSDWVEYCNLNTEGASAQLRIANGHPDPYRVKYWSIGNENWGGHEMGAKTVAEWGPFVREAAKLMVNVDPSIRLSAAALPDKRWTLPLLKSAGKHLDFISIHGYWDPLWQHDTPSDYHACMLRTLEPEKQILNTIALLKQTGNEGRLHIAFDEWNLRGWHHPGFGTRYTEVMIPARDRNNLDATYTMADALFSACFLNSCLRHAEHVTMACIAPGVNARGPLHVHPQGLVKRTTYHVMWMYATLLQPAVVPCTIKSEMLPRQSGRSPKVPAVDAAVTTSFDKTISVLALVNKHPDQPATCDLGFPGLPQEVDGMILEGDSPDAFNGIDMPSRVIPQKRRFSVRGGHVDLPAHSLVCLTITR